jgi:hypothetical protein
MTATDPFWKPYTQRAMKFLQDNRADILAYSKFLGVDTDAVAASILREITGVDKVYAAHDLPQTILRASVTLDTATGSLSGLPGTDFDLNARILADYQNTLNDHSWYLIRSIDYATGLSFTQFDIGPGKIRIDLAVDLIKEYLLSNLSNDVLGLKKYDGHYDQDYGDTPLNYLELESHPT